MQIITSVDNDCPNFSMFKILQESSRYNNQKCSALKTISFSSVEYILASENFLFLIFSIQN